MNLKNLLLAGVGSMAYAVEKSTETIEEMVKKGQITVAQGKELNQELKNKFMGSHPSYNNVNAEMIQEIINSINPATKEDLAELEARISRLEKQLP